MENSFVICYHCTMIEDGRRESAWACDRCHKTGLWSWSWCFFQTHVAFCLLKYSSFRRTDGSTVNFCSIGKATLFVMATFSWLWFAAGVIALLALCLLFCSEWCRVSGFLPQIKLFIPETIKYLTAILWITNHTGFEVTLMWITDGVTNNFPT